jgi:hypothetical protein
MEFRNPKFEIRNGVKECGREWFGNIGIIYRLKGKIPLLLCWRGIHLSSLLPGSKKRSFLESTSILSTKASIPQAPLKTGA